MVTRTRTKDTPPSSTPPPEWRPALDAWAELRTRRQTLTAAHVTAIAAAGRYADAVKSEQRARDNLLRTVARLITTEGIAPPDGWVYRGDPWLGRNDQTRELHTPDGRIVVYEGHDPAASRALGGLYRDALVTAGVHERGPIADLRSDWVAELREASR